MRIERGRHDLVDEDRHAERHRGLLEHRLKLDGVEPAGGPQRRRNGLADAPGTGLLRLVRSAAFSV